MTPAATADAREALRRAQDAVAIAVPATPREHVAEVVTLTSGSRSGRRSLARWPWTTSPVA